MGLFRKRGSRMTGSTKGCGGCSGCASCRAAERLSWQGRRSADRGAGAAPGGLRSVGDRGFHGSVILPCVRDECLSPGRGRPSSWQTPDRACPGGSAFSSAPSRLCLTWACQRARETASTSMASRKRAGHGPWLNIHVRPEKRGETLRAAAGFSPAKRLMTYTNQRHIYGNDWLTNGVGRRIIKLHKSKQCGSVDSVGGFPAERI